VCVHNEPACRLDPAADCCVAHQTGCEVGFNSLAILGAGTGRPGCGVERNFSQELGANYPWGRLLGPL